VKFSKVNLILVDQHSLYKWSGNLPSRIYVPQIPEAGRYMYSNVLV